METNRQEFLLKVFERYVDKKASILEIGCGDGRNVKILKENGWENVLGIDKIYGTSIQLVEEKPYDVIFTMSTLFLIPPEESRVFEKIARMVQGLLITIEGETTKEGIAVFGRNYQEVFEPLGLTQIADQTDVFNQYGVMRIFKKI